MHLKEAVMACRECENVARVAQCGFYEGHIGKLVLSRNHQLEIRVVDDGYFARCYRSQKQQERYVHLLYFGWAKDWARKRAYKKSGKLRRYLIQQLDAGAVHIKALNMQTGDYHFRPLQVQERSEIRTFLEQEHHFDILLLEGDLSAMSLNYRGVIQA